MAAAFREEGLGLMLDIVPNHMGIGGDSNPLWLDVLEWGRESRFAGWFDIDWAAPGLDGRLLLPVLGEAYGLALEGGALELRRDAGGFAVWAHAATGCRFRRAATPVSCARGAPRILPKRRRRWMARQPMTRAGRRLRRGSRPRQRRGLQRRPSAATPPRWTG